MPEIASQRGGTTANWRRAPALLQGAAQPQDEAGGPDVVHAWPGAHTPTAKHVPGGSSHVSAESTHAQLRISGSSPDSTWNAWQTRPPLHAPPQAG